MDNNVFTINLSEHGGPVYSGRPRGELLRKKLQLSKIDQDDSIKIKVVIPNETYSVTSSFFLGMFGPSITKAGSANRFNEKVNIQAPDNIKERLDSFIHRALQQKTLFGFNYKQS